MPIRRSRAIAAGAAVVVLAAVALWLRPAPVDVETARVERAPLRVTVDEEGVTRVRDRYVITAPSAGRLARVALEAGDSVRAGAVVARIDPALLDPRTREQAAARLSAADDAAREASTRVGHARLLVDQAERELARARQLAATGQVARRDLELAETARRERGAELEAARSREAQAVHEVEIARAALREPGARGAAAILVRAPVSGRVLRVMEKDERVVAAGTPLMEVGDPTRLEIVADLLSSDAARVRPGALMLVDGWGGDQSLAAHVRRVEPSAFTRTSALGIDEQRVTVVADIAGAPPPLGDRYRVETRTVVWEGADVLQLPVGALFRDGDAWCVFVVRDGRARRRTIVPGHRSSLAAEVMDGLAPGEVVIVRPGDAVVDGARVRPARER